MSAQRLLEILDKQQLVGGLVHNQEMHRHDFIETLVHRQHDAELLSFINQQSPTELGAMLDEIAPEQAQLVWSHVPQERQNDVLWEISDERREVLAPGREPDFERSKVRVFQIVDGRLRQNPIAGRKDLVGLKPIWVDLINTSKAERAYIGAYYKVDLPDPLEETNLEVTARFYVEENDDTHLHSNFLRSREGGSRSVGVAFILHGGILFSLRDEELPVFRLQRQRALTQPGYVKDCVDVLLDLYGADIEHSADTLEDIYARLSDVGRLVLSEAVTDEQAAETLAGIAEEEDLNGSIRSNILDTQRALNFLMRSHLLKGDQIEDAKQILRNIDSLNSHTSFLFDKINFLMDAILGFININQNKRVSQLTVFSVIFMPVNILAGMGGMSEFSMMTEGIPWPIAYGAFLLVGILIGYLTYLVVRHGEKKRLKQAALKPGHKVLG